MYHIKLGIATSNSRELVEATLEALGIRDYFDCVMTSCDVAKGKPAPDVFLLAAKISVRFYFENLLADVPNCIPLLLALGRLGR